MPLRDQRLVLIVTPTAVDSARGNGVTARRWAGMLEQLGMSTTLASRYDDQPADLLIALHATRSAESVRRFTERRPGAPCVVALTGTDLYSNIGKDPVALESLERADRIVALQPAWPEDYPERFHPKTRVIRQSVSPLVPRATERAAGFPVCVVGHLRPVKDPFRTAIAVRDLPPSSSIRVVHVGDALSEDIAITFPNSVVKRIEVGTPLGVLFWNRSSPSTELTSARLFGAERRRS